MFRLSQTSRRANPHQPSLGTEQGWGWEENGNTTMGPLAQSGTHLRDGPNSCCILGHLCLAHPTHYLCFEVLDLLNSEYLHWNSRF